MDLKDYIGVLKRRWVPFVVIFMVCVIVLLAYHYLGDVVYYKASGTVQIGGTVSEADPKTYWRQNFDMGTEQFNLDGPRVQGYAVKYLPVAAMLRGLRQNIKAFRLQEAVVSSKKRQEPGKGADKEQAAKLKKALKDAKGSLKSTRAMLEKVVRHANEVLKRRKEIVAPVYEKRGEDEFYKTPKRAAAFVDGANPETDGYAFEFLREYLGDVRMDLNDRSALAGAILAEMGHEKDAAVLQPGGGFYYRYLYVPVPKTVGVRIAPKAGARALEFSRMSTDPDEAVLHVFAMQLAATYDDNRRATAEQKKELNALVQKVEDLGRERDGMMQRMHADEQALDIKLTTSGDPLARLQEERNLAEKEWMSWDRKIQDIKANRKRTGQERAEMENIIRRLRGKGARAIPVSTSIPFLEKDSRVSSLRREHEQLTTNWRENSKIYRGRHRVMRQLRERMDSVEDNYYRAILAALSKKSEELQTEAQVLERDLKLAQDNSAETRVRFETAVSKLKSFQPEKYRALRDDLDSTKDQYKHFIKLRNEMEVRGKSIQGAYTIVPMSFAPELIPRKTKDVLLVGIIVSLLVAIGVVALWEYLDKDVRTEYDVRRYLNLPVLAIVPELRGEILLTEVDVKSKVSELFNTASTLIRSHAKELSLRSFCVSSANPKEGKTTISVNLAVAMARKGMKVCLVDSDLRRPQIHNIFGLRNHVGLSTLIEGKLDVVSAGERMYEECVQKTEIESLDVITSGPTPPDPVALLESDRLKSLLQELTDDYDAVLLDTPPIGSVGDTLILSQLIDANLFIVGSGQVDYAEVTQAKRLLTNIHANILGVFLNKAQEQKSKEYYYYYSDDTRRVGHIR